MDDLATYWTAVAYVLAGVVGLCIGSFLNVVIYRLPNGMSLSKPPSHCTSCDYKLKWYDNIPIFSYIFLGGKCRKCKSKISPRYIIVESVNAILWLACVWMFFDVSEPLSAVTAGVACMICSVCICIFCIDLEHLIIFDRFQIMLAVGAAWMVFIDRENWLSHLIGAVATALLLLIISFVFEKIYGMEALGGGDIKLCTVMGAMLGWQKTLLGLLISSVTASVILLMLRKRNNDSNDKMYPFGPFLTAGFLLAMLFGEKLLGLYLSLLGI